MPQAQSHSHTPHSASPAVGVPSTDAVISSQPATDPSSAAGSLAEGKPETTPPQEKAGAASEEGAKKVEVIDVDVEMDTKPIIVGSSPAPQVPQDPSGSGAAPPLLQTGSSSTANGAAAPSMNAINTPFLGNLPIDVVFEASKLPLDVAIFNSARAAGGDDKIRKYLQAVLVVGGSALIPGMAHALESRCVFFNLTFISFLVSRSKYVVISDFYLS